MDDLIEDMQDGLVTGDLSPEDVLGTITDVLMGL